MLGYSLNAGVSWTVVDAALPYSIPSTASQDVLAEPIGKAVLNEKPPASAALARPIVAKTDYPASAGGANPYNHSRPPVYTNLTDKVIDELRVYFGGFAVTASSDVIGASQPITFKAGYQAATGGAKIGGTSVTVAPNGFGYSVISGCNIQTGVSFYLNCRAETTGTTPTQFSNSSPARLAYSGTDAGDYTVAGSAQQPTGSGNGIIPIAVIGYAQGLPAKLVAVYGDSIAAGAIGEMFMDPAIRAAGCSVINGAVSGAQVNGQNLTNRIALARELGADFAISNYGINDARNGRTVAQIQGNLQTLWVNLRSAGHKKVFQCTLTPETTRIDSAQGWLAVNQQSVAATMAVVNPLNVWLRGGAGGLVDGVFDYSDVVSTSRDSGIFKDNYVFDGLHPDTPGASAAQTAMTAFVQANI